MPIYYDLDQMELSGSKLRGQFVLRYGVKIVLAAYRAVTESARGNCVEIQKRLATTVAELIESDDEISTFLVGFLQFGA